MDWELKRFKIFLDTKEGEGFVQVQGMVKGKWGVHKGINGGFNCFLNNWIKLDKRG